MILKQKKKIVSICLLFCCLVFCLPSQVQAKETDYTEKYEEEYISAYKEFI